MSHPRKSAARVVRMCRLHELSTRVARESSARVICVSWLRESTMCELAPQVVRMSRPRESSMRVSPPESSMRVRHASRSRESAL